MKKMWLRKLNTANELEINLSPSSKLATFMLKIKMLVRTMWFNWFVLAEFLCVVVVESLELPYQ